MVRRSVANNLNDLGKVHPKLLIETAKAWLLDATPERRKLVEHALRSAVKRGDREALALMGYGHTPRVAVERVVFRPRRVAIGGHVTMTFVLRSRSKRLQRLLVDVAVHFVKAHGGAIPKVFKLGRVDLPPGESIELKARFSLAVHTTRVPRPGDHAVDVVVNGHPIRAGSFPVSAMKSGETSPAPRRG
jgi:hypothetical protein